MAFSKFFCNESDPRTATLRNELDRFYDSVQNYESFEEPQDKSKFWGPIRDEIARIVQREGHCRVLEFGAGRTAFKKYFGNLSDRVRFEVQDVTRRHETYLGEQADDSIFGDLLTIDRTYNAIFSTFVWEHITTPQAFLDHLLKPLRMGGSLFLINPTYDSPLYISPLARHYRRWRQLIIAACLAWRRLRVALGGQPDFLIHVDPSVLHRTWYRDADAIHWLSRWDLVQYLAGRCKLQWYRVKPDGLRGWFWERFLLLYVQIIKPETQAPVAGELRTSM